jgi:MFS family permease
VIARFGRTFSSLKAYNYRLYFFGQLVSVSGSWMQNIAQAWLVLQLTNSPLALGTLTMLRFLPVTVLTLFGGVYADRWPKRQALFCLQSVAALQALLLAVLVLTNTIRLWELDVLAMLLGVVNAFENPLRQTFVMELVGKERLQNAVALNSSLMNSARIIGPAIAGVAIAVFGIGGGFLGNAVSFIALLLALVLMRSGELHRATVPRSKDPVFTQLREGLHYALHTPEVLLILILVGALGAFGYNTSTILPLVAKYVLHFGAAGFGLLLSAMGAGSLGGALWVASARRASLGVVLIAAAAFSLLLFLVGLSSWAPLTIGLLVLLGVASTTFSSNANTRLQLAAPEALRGRVLSMYFLLFAGTSPLGGFMVGALASTVGVPPMVMIMAALCAVGVVFVGVRAASGRTRSDRAPSGSAAAPKPLPVVKG